MLLWWQELSMLHMANDFIQHGDVVAQGHGQGRSVSPGFALNNQPLL